MPSQQPDIRPNVLPNVDWKRTLEPIHDGADPLAAAGAFAPDMLPTAVESFAPEVAPASEPAGWLRRIVEPLVQRLIPEHRPRRATAFVAGAVAIASLATACGDAKAEDPGGSPVSLTSQPPSPKDTARATTGSGEGTPGTPGTSTPGTSTPETPGESQGTSSDTPSAGPNSPGDTETSTSETSKPEKTYGGVSEQQVIDSLVSGPELAALAEQYPELRKELNSLPETIEELAKIYLTKENVAALDKSCEEVIERSAALTKKGIHASPGYIPVTPGPDQFKPGGLGNAIDISSYLYDVNLLSYASKDIPHTPEVGAFVYASIGSSVLDVYKQADQQGAYKELVKRGGSYGPVDSESDPVWYEIVNVDGVEHMVIAELETVPPGTTDYLGNPSPRAEIEYVTTVVKPLSETDLGTYAPATHGVFFPRLR